MGPESEYEVPSSDIEDPSDVESKVLQRVISTPNLQEPEGEQVSNRTIVLVWIHTCREYLQRPRLLCFVAQFDDVLCTGAASIWLDSEVRLAIVVGKVFVSVSLVSKQW